MPLNDFVLYQIAKRWKSPKAKQNQRFGAEPGTDAYALAYAWQQYTSKIQKGLGIDVLDRDVLEIGCGHGGITCFIAAAGARQVTGIDVNTANLGFARCFKEQLAARYEGQYDLPVSFMEMDATRLAFRADSFDVVIADNVFEHFVEPEKVLREIHYILRPGGKLHIPIFSSIYSKYGLHLKHGLKMPWANLFFSEAAIIRAMQRLANDNPHLLEIYPGLQGQPEFVRDLRAYGDLNTITFDKFKGMALATGFRIEQFAPVATLTGKVINRIPVLRQSLLSDIFSFGATATLAKQSNTRMEQSG